MSASPGQLIVGGDFTVARQAPASQLVMTQDFRIEPRPVTRVLVKVGGTLVAAMVKAKANGQIMDPEQ